MKENLYSSYRVLRFGFRLPRSGTVADGSTEYETIYLPREKGYIYCFTKGEYAPNSNFGAAGQYFNIMITADPGSTGGSSTSRYIDNIRYVCGALTVYQFPIITEHQIPLPIYSDKISVGFGPVGLAAACAIRLTFIKLPIDEVEHFVEKNGAEP